MSSPLLAAAIPYVAVLMGLYGLKSVWAAMGLYHFGALVFLLVHRGEPGWGSLLRDWRVSHAWPLVALGVLAGPAIYFLFPWAGLGPSGFLAGRLADLGLTGKTWWLFFVYYVAVTPWVEELLWRGRLGSPSRGIAASDLLFAGYHVLVLVKFLVLPWVLTAFLVLTGTAWLWRRAAVRGRGLLVPALSHFAGDVSAMLAVYGLIR